MGGYRAQRNLEKQKQNTAECGWTNPFRTTWKRFSRVPLLARDMQDQENIVDGCEIHFALHLEAMVETIAFWYSFIGESSFQGFSGGAGFCPPTLQV